MGKDVPTLILTGDEERARREGISARGIEGGTGNPLIRGCDVAIDSSVRHSVAVRGGASRGVGSAAWWAGVRA